MSSETNTTITFTPEEISQAATNNVYALCLVAVAYAKAHVLSPAEFWTFTGRQMVPFWEQGLTAEEYARAAALNMVSAGCDLLSLSGNESQATAVLGGWPPEHRHGLTQEEADTVWGVFGPIAESKGYSYEWHRQRDEVTMTFLRRGNA
jgi:hypothetical protein